MDSITVRDLVAPAQIGVPEEERAQAQNVLISFEIKLDLSGPAASDDLEQTLDYSMLASRVTDLVAAAPVKLLEHLAYRIAQFLLGLPGVEGVTIEVAKETPPIPQTVGRVSIRLERET